VNLILEREANDPELQLKLKEEAEAAAAAEAEQRKKLAQQKRADTQSRNKKIEEYMRQFHEEFPGEWSDEFARLQWQRAYNAYYTDLKKEEFNRQHEEDQRKMVEKEKRQKEQRELQRKAIARSKSPEYQIQMIFSPDDDYNFKTWYACRRPTFFDYYGRSTESLVDRLVDMGPGITLLQKEFRTGEIIKRLVGERAYNRLVEFGKPGETWEDCMNRLLDIAAVAQKS
jgi:hypothetical protein